MELDGQAIGTPIEGAASRMDAKHARVSDVDLVRQPHEAAHAAHVAAIAVGAKRRPMSDPNSHTNGALR